MRLTLDNLTGRPGLAHPQRHASFHPHGGNGNISFVETTTKVVCGGFVSPPSVHHQTNAQSRTNH